METESIKKSQTKGFLEKENIGKWTRATAASITNRIWEMKEKISGTDGTIEEKESLVKKNVKSKKFLTKNQGNLEQYENIIPKNNRNGSRIHTQIQENIIKTKFAQPKEWHTYKGTRSL